MTTGVRYAHGIVIEARPGFCRVRLDNLDSLITAWLPVIYPRTQDDKIIWSLDRGEQVACLLDSNLESGCIIGAIYSDQDIPPTNNTEKFRIQFKDGGSIEYDRQSGAMDIVCKGPAKIKADAAVTVTASRITLDTPELTCTGKLTVQGQLHYLDGLSGATKNGNAATLQGNVIVIGNINATGAIIDTGGNSNHHSH